MTVVYDDYYQAYDMHQFDISNVNFLAMLCDGTYNPKASDKLDDVTGLIIAVPYVITADDMVTKGMSELMEKTEADIKSQIEETPEQITEAYQEGNTWEYGRYVVMFNPALEILCYCEPINQYLNVE